MKLFKWHGIPHHFSSFNVYWNVVRIISCYFGRPFCRFCVIPWLLLSRQIMSRNSGDPRGIADLDRNNSNSNSRVDAAQRNYRGVASRDHWINWSVVDRLRRPGNEIRKFLLYSSHAETLKTLQNVTLDERKMCFAQYYSMCVVFHSCRTTVPGPVFGWWVSHCAKTSNRKWNS